MLNTRRARIRQQFFPKVIEEKQCFAVDVGGLDAVAHEGDKIFEAAGIVMPTASSVLIGPSRVVKAALGFGGLAVGQIDDFLMPLPLASITNSLKLQRFEIIDPPSYETNPHDAPF